MIICIGMNLTGKKFGRLTVLKRSNMKSGRNVLWSCKCECGKHTNSIGAKLKSGLKKSCGCLKAENVKPRFGKTHPQWSGYEGITGSAYSRIQNMADKRNIPFNVSIESMWKLFLKQNGKCALSGVDLYLSKSSKERKLCMTTASLDRIDSNKGYISGNIQWVHVVVNYMKQSFPQDEFINWCTLISKHNL